MKYLTTLAAGYFLPSILHTIATHPGTVDMLIGVLFGTLAGLLVAMVLVGPTPSPRHAPAIVTPARKPRTQKKSTVKQSYGFTPINYEWSPA